MFTNLTKKFFDIAPTEAAAATAPVETAPAAKEVVAKAETMATKGVFVEVSEDGTEAKRRALSGRKAAKPAEETKVEVKTETKEPKAETPTPHPEKKEEAAPIVESKVETTATKEPAGNPTPQPPVAPAPKAEAKVETKATKQDWQEVLKQQQPDEILKALGYDEKAVKFFKEVKQLDEPMQNFITHWKNKGDVKSYLEAMSVDYSKMGAEEIMRYNLLRDNPELKPDQFERLYRMKVTNRYNLESEDPEAQADGQVELLADAKPLRQRLAEEQKKFLLPAAPEATVDPRIADYEQLQQAVERATEDYKKQVVSDPYTKNIIAGKAITIGRGEEKFNYELQNPNDVLNLLLDKDAWGQAMYKKDEDTGELVPDMEKQLLIATIVHDHQGFLKALSKHFKTLGSQAVTAPIENSKPVELSKPVQDEPAPKNAAEAMAKRGKIVSTNPSTY